MKTARIAAWALAVLATAPGAAAQTLDPAAAATIRRLPELNIFEVAPNLTPVQSSYFRTTELNREFRRGIAEFAVPAGTILGATLVLAESRATIAPPVPPDVHRVTAYAAADLAVTTDDYDRPGTALGTIATDANDATQTFTFDVTSLAVAAAGGSLGFRVQLAVDPDHADMGFLGSAFTVTLAIVTPPPLAIRFDFSPEVLVLGARGRWVTGVLEPPAPFAAATIDLATVRLNGVVPVDPAAPAVLEDHDGNGIVDLTLKFARDQVEATVVEGNQVPITVTGTLDGGPFAGTDFIRVFRGGPRVAQAVEGSGLAVASSGPAPLRTSNGVLRVELTLRSAHPARLQLIDLAGRAVATQPLGALGAGRHRVDLVYGRDLTPGIYFLRVIQGGEEAKARVAVLR